MHLVKSVKKVPSRGIYISVLDGCIHCVKLKKAIKNYSEFVSYSVYPDTPKGITSFPAIFVHGRQVTHKALVDLLQVVDKYELFFLVS
jgi:hypothetical protein